MKCPKCQRPNPDDAVFCNGCGNRLELACPKCGKVNPPDSRFCNGCGQGLGAEAIDYDQPQSYTPKHLADKILTSRSAMEGERKLVTVLFADVANYTSLSEKLDPEEVHQIMDGCFKILMDEIHRYEGTINQFTGDGVMALFGAPVSHEDHAQRACYSALSIQKSMEGFASRIERDRGIDFKIRIGINSGPVIVGSIGDDLRMDYTAVGDTTNLAARIQQNASPGEIWLSDHTQGLIGGFFEVERVGELQLKGKAEPQPTYRITSERKGVRTRFEAGLAKGVTELVGRRPEMDILRTAWERVKSGEARVVDVVGEAGVGKSRLIYEFQRSIAEEATILTGVCITYGRNISYLPVIDVVKGAFGIKEGMTEAEVRKRIEKEAKGSLGAMIPFYHNLLSLKVEDPRFSFLNPEGRKFGTFEAVKSLLLSLSVEKPLVVFLEDVHWIDKISEDFFVYFSRSIHGKKVLMLTAYRPEGAPEWAKGSHYRHLGLETLSEKSSARLVRNILGGVDMEPELERRIVFKTGGNPFFVEEMVHELLQLGHIVKEGNRYLSRKPIDQLDIPDSVQGVLAARMDRLSEDLKRTMQVASVIGRDFAYKILRSIMELGDELRSHLTNLVGIEVLYEKALYPELEYIFKHALTQEVAYESLLKQRRREIHGRIARTIEELYAGSLEEHYEVLAHHWELSTNPDRSIEYFVLAGEKANRNNSAYSAVDFFSRALDQMQKSQRAPDPKLMLQIRIGRAHPLHAVGRLEESLGDYEEAIRLAGETGDQQKLLKCLNEISSLIYNTTFKDKAPRFYEQAIGLARALGDKGNEAGMRMGIAYWRYIWQDSDELENIQEALRMAEESKQPVPIMRIRFALAALDRWGGYPLQALERTEGMIEVLHSMFNIGLAGLLSFGRGLVLTDVGRYGEAIRLQGKWIDTFEQNPNYLLLGRFYNCQGWTYSELYDLEKALSLNSRSIEVGHMVVENPANVYSATEMRAQTEVNLMENAYEMGKTDDAWEHILRFEKESEHPDFAFLRNRWMSRMEDLKCTILLSRGDLDAAEALARQCLEGARKRKYKKYVGKAERLLGRVLTERQAYDVAESRLQSALSELKEVGNPKQIWMTRTALARLYEKMNRPDLAREQWHVARAIVESTAEGLDDQQLRTTFLNAAPIREIIQASNP